MFNFFGKKKKTIRVTILDADSNELIGNSDQPIDTLPDTFAIETNMSIRDVDYLVVDAQPQRKEEFEKSGELTLKLRKIAYVNPNDVLMTLPTISDALPPLGADPLPMEGYFNMHEDDWRQVEFISRSQLVNVEKELDGVRNIYENHSVPFEGASFGAFKKLHQRKLITQPIPANTISWEELKNVLGGTVESLSFSTSGGKPYAFVTNGFAVRNGESVFYGNIDGGNVITLGVYRPEESAALCETLKQRYDVMLVDWVRAEMV